MHFVIWIINPISCSHFKVSNVQKHDAKLVNAVEKDQKYKSFFDSVITGL